MVGGSDYLNPGQLVDLALDLLNTPNKSTYTRARRCGAEEDRVLKIGC